MSYNGIGLQTARGSGTSGHVQTNLAKRGNHDHHTYESRQRETARQLKQQTLAAHHQKQLEARDKLRDDFEAKRAIEVQCAQLRDQLEDDSEDDEVIEAQVAQLRAKLIKEHDVVEYIPLRHRQRSDNSGDSALVTGSGSTKPRKEVLVDDKGTTVEVLSEVKKTEEISLKEEENDKIPLKEKEKDENLAKVNKVSSDVESEKEKQDDGDTLDSEKTLSTRSSPKPEEDASQAPKEG